MLQKNYLPDRPAFEQISRDWPPGTPEPPYYPCVAVWCWYHGQREWVAVEYVYPDDFKDETPDEYLDRLISEAGPDMDKIKDLEEWLKQVRGYSD